MNIHLFKNVKLPLKLTYFNVRGLGESIRYLLHDQDIAFEDFIVEFSAWGELKKTFIYGQIPALTLEDGTVLTQSNAILRHLGRVHKLYGETDLEAALIDQLIEGDGDQRRNYLKLIYGGDFANGKAAYIKSLDDGLAPFEKQLASNAGGSGFMVGGKISFADYKLLDLLDIHLILAPNCLDNFPLLKAYQARIAARPRLAQFRQTDAHKNRKINGNDNC